MRLDKITRINVNKGEVCVPWIINKSIKRENRKETEEDPVRQNNNNRKECCSGSQEVKRSNRSKTTNQSLNQMGTVENPPLGLAPWWSWVFAGENSVRCKCLGGDRRRRAGHSSRDDSCTNF